ncbi:hypothetical protein [Herbaspirillum sp. SJZ099]|uniref:hypothetical protein n=1 Tax=Herbaspirillum sp. SJZ099 TaxID=2572916 RepID=UPI00119E351F|nr:hypothetical protein [Herbaspirillum sp. SJZ099]TWC69956.1 outer protein D [Herbaspirillum sp. SJZ099]
MSMILNSGSCFFNRTLSDKLIQRAIEGSSKETSIHIGIWEKIKDWFCGTDSKSALDKIYDLTHANENPSENNKTEFVLNRAVMFFDLKHMAYPAYQDRFQASIIKLDNGSLAFSFSIKDAMDERTLPYGDVHNEIHSVNERNLTNDSEFLDKRSVEEYGLHGAMSTVEYDLQKDEFKGINEHNQRRINSHLLRHETKEKLSEYPELAQEWIRWQANCYDHYASLDQSLMTGGSLHPAKLIGTDDEWMYDLFKSVNEIRAETNQAIADKFNAAIYKAFHSGMPYTHL